MIRAHSILQRCNRDETETFGFWSETETSDFCQETRQRPRPCKAETETFFETFILQHCAKTMNGNVQIITSVVTVSKISPSVGFDRFCKKNHGFRFGFGFCLSRFPPVVNVVRLCGPLHIKPAAVRYIFLCITPVDSSKYPTSWDWWRENHQLYQTSHVLRNATCLAVCATDIRC